MNKFGQIISLASLLLLVDFATRPAKAQVVPSVPTSLPSPLTLDNAITIALKHQPQQYIAQDQTTQAKGQKQQAQAGYLPKVTPTYQFQNRNQAFYGVTQSTTTTTTGTTGTGTTGTGTGTTGTGTTGTGTGTTGTGTTGTSNSVTTNNNSTTLVRGGGLSVSLTQTLYDGGAREATNAQARRAVDIANYNFLNTRQSTILTVTQDYYQLLQALDLVKVAQSQVDRQQQTVEVTQAQIDAGTVAKKDIYQAQADLANAQVTLLQDQNQVRLNSAALKNALGVATSETVQPAPLAAGDTLPPLPAAGTEQTLDQALATAYSHRPDLAQQLATVQSNETAVQQARRNAGLTINSTYALTYQATNDLGYRGLDSQLLVSGSYPLFDAGDARGAVRIAEAQRDSAKNQLELQRQVIRQDVEQTFATRAESLQAAQLAQSAITAAQVNFDAALASRREGIGTVQDITTAQTTLTQAQNQYVTAVYNFYVTDAQLQRSIGLNDAGR